MNIKEEVFNDFDNFQKEEESLYDYKNRLIDLTIKKCDEEKAQAVQNFLEDIKRNEVLEHEAEHKIISSDLVRTFMKKHFPEAKEQI